jgi:hypothetical protein
VEPFPPDPTQRKQWPRAVVCALVSLLPESDQSLLLADLCKAILKQVKTEQSLLSQQVLEDRQVQE